MRRTAFLSYAVLAVLALSVAVKPAHAAPRKPFVVGGTPIAINQAPYQVYVERPGGACGGSILNANTVLTAAHCVIPEGQTAPRPPGEFTVLAGSSTNNIAQPPSGSQRVGVASLRTHPNYEAQTKTDDVAVLTLSSNLNLASPVIEAIALAPVGGAPAPGTQVGLTGYGRQSDGQVPDGRLYAATLVAISDIDCRSNINTNASAGVLCVGNGPPASCEGDSGGPLTAGGVQVGVASYRPLPGCGLGPSGFADVTAPEVRAFIDGAAIPLAPRQSAFASLFSVNPPIHGSPIRCEPGAWAGAEALGYTFINGTTGAVLQSGPSNVFAPAAGHVGAPIQCAAAASNAGGTSTGFTGVSAPVQPDLVRPTAVLRSVRCRKRRCTVKIRAADANSLGALRIGVTAKQRGRKARKLRVKKTGRTSYRARSRRLPRGSTTIRVRVRDAAGNRRKPDMKRRVTVR